MDSATENTKDFRVAIIGGGICGLATAVGLTKAGLDVDIYETAPKFGEVGAGVGFGANAVRALQELGVLEEVLSRTEQEKPEVRPFLFLSGLGEHEQIYDYPVGPDDVGLGVYRPAFLEALVHLVDPSKTHFNKRCISLIVSSTDSHKMQINFADGTITEADIILGTDGIKSVTRTYVVEGLGGESQERVNSENSTGAVRAVFTNTIAYRGLVPASKLRELGVKTDLSARPLCWIGPGKHIITFPIKGNQIVNVVAFACDRNIKWGEKPLPPGQPWVSPRTKEELLADFEGWGRDVQLLLSCLDNPSVWSIHAVDPPLETYCRGRVALVGDSAHGMLPHLGAGAGQGVEDALAIVKLLGHPNTNNGNVEAVLQAYDVIRRPRANMVLTASTKNGDVYEQFGPSGGTIEGLKKDLPGCWEPIWHHDLHADIDKAIDWLQEKGAFP